MQRGVSLFRKPKKTARKFNLADRFGGLVGIDQEVVTLRGRLTATPGS